jgi:hypothetical protein
MAERECRRRRLAPPQGNAAEGAFHQPGHDLVLGNTWSFHVSPLDDDRRTRLIVRGCGAFNPDFGPIGNLICWRVLFGPAHFIMERKMLGNVKALAERYSVQREAAALASVP